MPRTTGRTLALLGLLQAHREWSGAELQTRLGVSARTLRRDIDDLRGLGYGIDSVSGVGGATGSELAPQSRRSCCQLTKRSRSPWGCAPQPARR